MEKKIRYKRNVYTVCYDYQQPRGITCPRQHRLELIKINGKVIPSYEITWLDLYNKRESIISKVGDLLDGYIASNMHADPELAFTEYVNWDGDLDSWDE